MTTNSRNEAQPASLSLSRVSRLIELEQIEMDRRVAERHRPHSNVLPFKARASENAIDTKLHSLRRSYG